MVKKANAHTAAAYIRVSTEEQTEFSPDSQLKKIQEYARSKQLLLPEAYIYMDEGISGRSAQNRPAFMSMIRAARQKPRPFDLILVWKFSRFARNRQDSILYKSMLRRECGIDVVSITEQLSEDPSAILIEALLEAMDEYYSINLAQEVRRGMNEKFSRGGVVNPPPFGYRMGKSHFEADEKNAPLVQMIFRDFLNGSSFRQIAGRLNQRNVRTSRGNPFEARTVKYILENPAYLGLQRRNLSGSREEAGRTIVSGFHPPIITEEIFRQAQKRIQYLSKTHIPKSRAAPASFMLKGLVRCSRCGSTLTLSKKHQTLQCHKYTKGLCPESHSILLVLLNQAVLSQIRLDFPDFLRLQLQIKTQRKTLPFRELPELLEDPSFSEDSKNKLLRSFISRIIFYRRENAIQIYYR